MTLNNENKKLSRNRKNRIERKYKTDDKLKHLFKKTNLKRERKPLIKVKN